MRKTNFRFAPLIALALFTLTSLAAADIYIINTAVNPANGHSYHLVSDSPDGLGRFAGVTWSQAENYAQTQFNSHLATINDSAENDWITQTFTDHTDNGFVDLRIGIFVGFTDTAQEGVWNWISGETPGFTNWISGEPDGAYPVDGTADYALVRPWGLGDSSDWGKWFDAHDVESPQTTGGYIHNYGLIEVVPEPTSIALLTFGGLALLRRKRLA